VTNTPAYCGAELITAVIYFIVPKPGFMFPLSMSPLHQNYNETKEREREEREAMSKVQ
jgi:hypothetical protein